MSDPARGGPARKPVGPRGRGRRTAEDRARFLEEENRRTRARDEERRRLEEADKAAAERAKRRREQQNVRRRARGGFMGDRQAPSAAPSGPFSLGSIINPHHQKTFSRPWAPSRRGRTGAARNFSRGTKRATQAGPSTQAQPDETNLIKDETDSSSDSEGGGRRVNVNDFTEYVNLISDDEDGAPDRPEPSSALLPIRITRQEHVDRALQINPDGSGVHIKKEDNEDYLDAAQSRRRGKQRARDFEVTHTERRWRGVFPDDDDILIKEESQEPTAATIPPAGPRLPRESQTERRARIKANKKKMFNKPPASFPTDEDREEWERWALDRTTIVEELGPFSHLDLSHDDEKMNLDAPSHSTKPPREDHSFLLHFPPVLADLLDPSKIVKPEPASPTRPVTEAGPSTADANGSGEPGEEEEITIKEEAEPKTGVFPVRPAHLPTLESGFVGKLRVYKSGKTELDWGGISLEVKKGITPQFLQSVVMVRVNEETEKPLEGEAISFGQVRGKFIVTPDFDEIFS